MFIQFRRALHAWGSISMPWGFMGLEWFCGFRGSRAQGLQLLGLRAMLGLIFFHDSNRSEMSQRTTESLHTRSPDSRRPDIRGLRSDVSFPSLTLDFCFPWQGSPSRSKSKNERSRRRRGSTRHCLQSHGAPLSNVELLSSYSLWVQVG